MLVGVVASSAPGCSLHDALEDLALSVGKYDAFNVGLSTLTVRAPVLASSWVGSACDVDNDELLLFADGSKSRLKGVGVVDFDNLCHLLLKDIN